MKMRQLSLVLTIFFAAHVSLAAQTPAAQTLVPQLLTTRTKAVNVTGKWQISWEARVGTERDTIELQQTESKLTGVFCGKLGSPKVSGNVDGRNIALRLDFVGRQPYSIVFTGTLEDDTQDGQRLDSQKMSGKFEIPGVAGAYDWHGENVHSTNYTWSAVRLSNTPQPGRTPPDVVGAQPSPPGPPANRASNSADKTQ
jgi:hypothetical protein